MIRRPRERRDSNEREEGAQGSDRRGASEELDGAGLSDPQKPVQRHQDCKAGNLVVIGDKRAYIKNIRTGEVTELRRERKAWMLDMWMKAPAGFPRAFPQGVSLRQGDVFIPSSVRPLLGLDDDEEIEERDKEKAEWKKKRRSEAEGRQERTTKEGGCEKRIPRNTRGRAETRAESQCTSALPVGHRRQPSRNAARRTFRLGIGAHGA